MSAPRLAVGLALVVLAASVGVGAATPSATYANAGAFAANHTEPAPLGESISAVMQASAGQAAGAVETGMWVAAYANASNASEKRALVERRVGQLGGTVEELRAEREALRERYQNGSIDRATYRARLSALVGRLAAVGEAIEAADARGQAVGVNATRLDELRSQARDLSGAEVSRLARNLTDRPGGPGSAGLFDDGSGKSGQGGGPPDDPGGDARGDGDDSRSAGNASTTRSGGSG